ncbi:MAG: hypothetical protein AB3A66_28985 (plasmid) [Nodularia sp. CChRGM 3473]
MITATVKTKIWKQMTNTASQSLQWVAAIASKPHQQTENCIRRTQHISFQVPTQSKY